MREERVAERVRVGRAFGRIGAQRGEERLDHVGGSEGAASSKGSIRASRIDKSTASSLPPAKSGLPMSSSAVMTAAEKTSERRSAVRPTTSSGAR